MRGTLVHAALERLFALDPVERTARRYGGGYGAYLAEREVARRHAREAFDSYAETRADLTLLDERRFGNGVVRLRYRTP